MQNPQGRVVSVHAGSAGGRVVVEVDAGVVCARCEAGKGCGAGLLGRGPRSRLVNAAVAASIDLSAGDLVRISLQPGNVLRAAGMVYGYPLAGVVAAVAAALAFGLGDIGAALAALAGIAGGFRVAKTKLRGTNCLREFTPLVSEKLRATAAED